MAKSNVGRGTAHNGLWFANSIINQEHVAQSCPQADLMKCFVVEVPSFNESSLHLVDRKSSWCTGEVQVVILTKKPWSNFAEDKWSSERWGQPSCTECVNIYVRCVAVDAGQQAKRQVKEERFYNTVDTLRIASEGRWAGKWGLLIPWPSATVTRFSALCGSAPSYFLSSETISYSRL